MFYNLIIYCNCVHLYIHVFSWKNIDVTSTSSARRWVWIVVLRTQGWPLKGCGLGKFDPKSTTFNGWTPQITHIKRKNHLPNPSFCMSILVFRFFGSVLFWKDLSCSDRFSINSCSRWSYCSTTFHIFGPEDFHPICLFLPTKPIIGGANICCILVYPLPVLPDHEHPRVPCPTSPPGWSEVLIKPM